jgi:uncharacterized protein (DUF111 family)
MNHDRYGLPKMRLRVAVQRKIKNGVLPELFAESKGTGKRRMPVGAGMIQEGILWILLAIIV